MKTYSHGGDLGDLIAGLAALKLAGGGELVLHPSDRVREQWFPAKVDRVREFLLMQPYVHGVRFAHRPEGIQLDRWRYHRVRSRLRREKRNILDWHTDGLELPRWKYADSWLTVDRAERVASTVFNRTLRYWGCGMKKAVAEFGSDAVFLGTADEHSSFLFDCGEVRHHSTPSLLDAARTIAGAERYVGNQSSLLWVAMGLGVPVCVEEWAVDENCRMNRASYKAL